MSDLQKADPFNEGPVAAKARRQRSWMIAAGLIAFVIIVFAVTMVKLGVNAHHLVQQTS